MALNILLMGQTGTGKTTFINSFINYLVYNMLDDALNGELRVLIPSKFSLTNKDTYKPYDVVVGNLEERNAESAKAGHSSTKSCQSYLFSIGSHLIRFIDAPGIGDTQSIEQDSVNLEHILAYIGQYQYLNGICIFLKSNESRLTQYFRYCIKEILRHLHVNMKDKIMFAFTYGQTANFEPGQTVTVLKDFLTNLEQSANVEVPLNKDNSFFFDNESLFFVARYKQGFRDHMSEKNRTSTSWSKSANEIRRMFEFILKRQQSAVEDTQSLIKAKRLMSQLARPIAEAIKLLQENRLLVEEYQKKIRRGSSKTQADSIPEYSVRLVELPKPLTVCIDPRCTRLVNVSGQRKVDYYKYCHNGCYLKNVVQECIGHPILKRCAAMTKEGTCKNCDCGWQKHMHVTYRLEKDERNWLKKIFSKDGRIPNDIIPLIERRISDLDKETEMIRDVCVKLSAFIKKNSIVSFNDDILEYLKMECYEKKQIQRNDRIQDEIKKIENLIARSEAELKHYRDMEERAQNDLNAEQNEIEEFFENVNKLYQLEFSGEMIKMQVGHIQRVSNNVIPTHDIRAEVPPPSDGSTLLINLSEMKLTEE